MDEPSLRIERRSSPGGAVVYVDGRPLTGPDPVSSMQRRLPDPNSLSSQTLFLILSPLDGFGVAEWMTRIPATCGVLIVELDPELAELYPRPTGWTYTRRSVQAHSWDTAVHAADRLIHHLALRRLHTIHLTGGSRLYRTRYQNLEGQLRHAIQRYWNNRGTQIRLQRRWVANLIRNVVREGAAVTSLYGRTGTRAILVGAGPSLDAHIPLLAQLFPAQRTPDNVHASGILVAIDTALPALAAANIQPDFVVTMDSQLANAQDFLPWHWDRTAVIADATTHFSIPRRFPPSRRYWFVSRFAQVQLFTDPELATLFAGIPILPPLGSVAPSAVHILSKLMGVAELLLVGIDFWYRPPHSHAYMSTADRWLSKGVSRVHHRDGHDRALARPVREMTLKDGTRAWGDSILFDQAQHAGEVISQMPSHVYQLPGAGLEIGATPMSPESVATWWSSGAAPGVLQAQDSHTDGSAESLVRMTAVRALLRRLQALEERLQRPDSATLIDAGLDFTLVDLPQWPLMTLSPDWMQLHRLRILRSVRDYRRRVETLLLRSAPED